MDSTDIYFHPGIVLDRKTPSNIYSWITILIVSSISILLITLIISHDKHISYDAIINEGLIELYVDNEFFNTDTNTIKILDKNFEYKTVTIEPFIHRENKPQVWKVIISADIPDDWIIDNNHIRAYFNQGRTTLFKEIIKTIKKGLRT